MSAINLEEYVALAIALGHSRGSRSRALQQGVKEQRLSTKLFDTKRWVFDWERAISGMWDDYRSDPHGKRYHIVLAR
jgi:predicted O-linked N-acetylglucosamine transferase (SPINDLY family)